MKFADMFAGFFIGDSFSDFEFLANLMIIDEKELPESYLDVYK